LNPEKFKQSSSGKCIKTLTGYWAYIPNPLPPKINYSRDFVFLLSEGDRLLGELSGIGRLIPNPYLLIAPYIRREAISSSRIEGTQASLNDLFLFEAGKIEKLKMSDVHEVKNYIKAMEYGLNSLKNLPISVILLSLLPTVKSPFFAEFTFIVRSLYNLKSLLSFPTLCCTKTNPPSLSITIIMAIIIKKGETIINPKNENNMSKKRIKIIFFQLMKLLL